MQLDKFIGRISYVFIFLAFVYFGGHLAIFLNKGGFNENENTYTSDASFHNDGGVWVGVDYQP